MGIGVKEVTAPHSRKGRKEGWRGGERTLGLKRKEVGGANLSDLSLRSLSFSEMVEFLTKIIWCATCSIIQNNPECVMKPLICEKVRVRTNI